MKEHETNASRIVDSAFHLLESLLALLLIGMVALVFGNVALRYGLQTGIVVSEGLSRFFMVWLVFIGAVVAMRDGSHLGSDTLLSHLPVVWQRVFAGLSQVLILYCCYLLVRGLWQQHDLYAGTSAPVSGLSMIWVYGVGYPTGLGIALITLHRLIRIITNQASSTELGLSSSPEPL